MPTGEDCCDLKSKDNVIVYSIDEEDKFPPGLQKTVEKIIKKEGYVQHKVFKRMISTDGGNYLGVLYEVDIQGKTAEGDKGTNIFIKNIIPAENCTFISVDEAYLKESYAYKELFKIYRDLQNEANVPIEERLRTVKSFYSDSDSIFLENMSKKGYKTLDRMDVMPLKFAELSVQQLAKFHGLSFVLQNRNPEYFNCTLKVMASSYNFNSDFKAFVENTCEMAFKYLDERYREKIKIPELLEKYESFFKEVSWGCICHSDYRQNNILLKEIDGQVIDVVPIDYQLLYYGCPLNDFFYLIFCGSDQEFRRNHMIDLKNMYYDSLEKFLKYFDMDVNVTFSRKVFEKYYEERIFYGLILSLTLVPCLFVKEDNVPDLGKTNVKDITFTAHDGVQERLRGLLDDFEQWGII